MKDKDQAKPKEGDGKAVKQDQKAADKSQKGDKDKTKTESDPKAKKDQQKPEKETSSGDNKKAAERLKTTPYDPRFPNVNQTRNCYQNYLDYHRCLKVKNDESFCHYYKWAYNELCPKAWHQKWDDQRERGIFPGVI